MPNSTTSVAFDQKILMNLEMHEICWYTKGKQLFPCKANEQSLLGEHKILFRSKVFVEMERKES